MIAENASQVNDTKYQSISPDDLKSRLKIEDYASRHLTLKKAGRRLKTCCPFHAESTPSFFINPDTQRWDCFGACAEGGDIFSLAMKLNNWSFHQAKTELAREIGLDSSAPRNVRTVARLERDTDNAVISEQLHTAFWEAYQRSLERKNSAAGRKAIAFLQREGIEDTSSFGFNPTPYIFYEAEGHKYKMHAGIVFPLFQDGKLHGLKSRTITGSLAAALECPPAIDKDGNELAKYMCCTGTRLVYLYGSDSMKSGLPALFVEGEKDATNGASRLGDMVNVVTRGAAGSHKTLTPRHIELLSDAPVIYIALDNDRDKAVNTGQNTAQALAALIGDRARIIHYPDDCKDLSEMVKKGYDVQAWFEQQMAQALPPAPSPAPHISAPAAPAFTPLIDDTLEGIPVTHVDVRYVSELPLEMFLNRCVLLKAGGGQGKTTLAERLQPDRIACPRQSLVSDLGRRFDLPTSNTIPAAYQYQPDGFVYCLPSILNQIDARGNIRIPRCLVIDEIEQLILALFSSIISKRDRPRIFAALCTSIQHAPTVLCLDADAGSLSYHFLKTLRSDVTFIVNDYRDTSRKMLKYENKSDIEKAIDAAVREDKGLIAIPCTSDELAQDFGDTYSPVLGAERVLVITANTKKTDPRVREFLEHPDHHAGKYALITYSSAMGTGVDISETKPRGVFAVLGRNVLTAWDMHQMIMRFRHAETYHVWVDKTLVTLPTDAALIEAKQLEAEKFTRDVILFDGQGRDLVQLQRKKMTALASQVAARRNSSLVNVRGHFFSLAAERFTILTAGTKASREEHEQIKATLSAARDARKAEDDARVLNPLTKPITTPIYKRFAVTGQLTVEIEAGHKKQLVQETYGQDVTPETLADYGDKGEGRAQLLLLESLYHHEGESKTHDAEELTDGVYAGDLTHATQRRKLLLEVMRPFMNEARQFDTSAVIERSTIDEYMTAFLVENERFVRLYFGWRNDYSTSPKNLLRFMLSMAGLKMERVRRRDGVQRYRIEPETLSKMERYIRQRKAALPKSVKESYTPIQFQGVN